MLQRLPIAEAVPIYEQLLGVFPTCVSISDLLWICIIQTICLPVSYGFLLLLQAKYWKQYVEAHMAVNNDDATRLIFSRCLLNCLQVPLWSLAPTLSHAPTVYKCPVKLFGPNFLELTRDVSGHIHVSSFDTSKVIGCPFSFLLSTGHLLFRMYGHYYDRVLVQLCHVLVGFKSLSLKKRVLIYYV